MSRTEFPGVTRLRRRALVRRVVVLGALLVVLLVSALLWPRQRPGALAVPTASAQPEASGVLRGELSAERAGGTVCFTVASDDGPALLVLPRGWSADDRRALLDASGSVVAQPDDEVQITGDPGEAGSIPGCAGSGRVWSVASVTVR